jgi:hypothetical protein
MPRKKHNIKARNKNVEEARRAKAKKKSQSEFCQPLWL